MLCMPLLPCRVGNYSAFGIGFIRGVSRRFTAILPFQQNIYAHFGQYLSCNKFISELSFKRIFFVGVISLDLNLDDYTFGVEIEFTGCSRRRAANVVSSVLTDSIVEQMRNGENYRVTDGRGRIWKVTYDGSITAQKKHDGNIIFAAEQFKCELVTPILKYSEDIGSLQEIVRALRKAGAFTNSSTGIHVHVGAAMHTPKTLKNLANIFRSKQDLLYKALDVNPTRTSYCKKLEDGFMDRLNADKQKTDSWFADDVYHDFGGPLANYGVHYSQARYYGINFHAYFTKKTVEFRLFNATLHAGCVRTYVILAIAMNNQAINQKCASSKKTVTTNESYTFRTWLLRMGFIGKEFETPRKILLDNLEGNKVWRDR